jgi:hypothetical protein
MNFLLQLIGMNQTKTALSITTHLLDIFILPSSEPMLEHHIDLIKEEITSSKMHRDIL